MPVVSIPPPQPAPINIMPPLINVTQPRIEATVPIPTSPVAGFKETPIKASTQSHENNLPRTSRTGRQIRTPIRYTDFVMSKKLFDLIVTRRLELIYVFDVVKEKNSDICLAVFIHIPLYSSFNL